jgi:hypothetical protein
MTETVYEKARELFVEIVASKFPQNTNERPAEPDYGADDYYEKRRAIAQWRPNPEASAFEHKVKSVKDVEVGDLLIVRENARRRGEWSSRLASNTTISEFLTDGWSNATLCVVVSKSAKQFTVSNLSWGSWTENPETLDYQPDAVWRQERMSGSTQPRTVVHSTLTYDGLIAAIKADERLPELLRLQKKGWDLLKEEERKADAERAAADAARAPFQAKAKRLNEALMVGADIVAVPSYGAPSLKAADLQWFSQKAFAHLAHLALGMRLSSGAISPEEYREAVEVLHEAYGISKEA